MEDEVGNLVDNLYGYYNKYSTDKIVYIILVVIVIVIIILLIVYEYNDHDCISGKECYHRVNNPTEDMSKEEYIERIQEMVNMTTSPVIWRQALLVSLIIALPVIFFIQGRWPLIIEYIVVVAFIFLAIYLSYSWIWAHFYNPNSIYLEESLNYLKEKNKNNNNK